MTKANTSETRSLSARHAVFCNNPLQRVSYFEGQVLGTDDFQAEQEYHRNKQRRHNLHFHGVGIVQGLHVSTTKEKAHWSVVVEAGVAIDAIGNEVHLCTAAKFPLPEKLTRIQVGIRFSERLRGSVPVGGAPSGEPDTMPTRVEEGCEVILEPPLSARSMVAHAAANASADVLPLARVIRRKHAWQLDRRFKVPHTR
jgi:hypothetical protein